MKEYMEDVILVIELLGRPGKHSIGDIEMFELEMLGGREFNTL
jgi:hypothetical protein